MGGQQLSTLKAYKRSPELSNSKWYKGMLHSQRMELPTDADAITYAQSDLTETIRLFEQYGIRFLTPNETLREMPQYPFIPPAE